MTEREKISFRLKFVEYMSEIIGADNEKQIRLLEGLEKWIDDYASLKVSQAIQPFIKIQTNDNRRKN